jgi:N-acetylglucosamine kinase-like BadF-type ATPase
MLIEETGAATANDLLHRFYTDDLPRPRIASLARLVDRGALEGDAVAREIAGFCSSDSGCWWSSMRATASARPRAARRLGR